jgi:hypothetical protein
MKGHAAWLLLTGDLVETLKLLLHIQRAYLGEEFKFLGKFAGNMI